jgi:hypothetical protein
VPYIGDLIGYRTLHDAGEPVRETAQRAAARARILFPRRDVGNTLRYRRRKGTLALLDDLAAAVSGWPARAVEFSRLVAATQSLQHLRLTQGGTADVRRTDLMGRIGSASDETAHLVEVRRPQSKYGPGKYNGASVGVLVWRLRCYAVERTQAYCVEWEGRECYTFSVLGNDCPLFASVAGAAEVDPVDPAERLAPLPIALRRGYRDATWPRQSTLLRRRRQLRVVVGPQCNQAPPAGAARRCRSVVGLERPASPRRGRR